MSSDATMDVARAAEYGEIENSILDAPIVGNWQDPASLAQLDEGEHEPQGVEPGGGELLADLQTDRQGEQVQAQEQHTAPEAQQTPQEFTPAMVEESVKELSQAVEQYGLADETAALRLVQELGGSSAADVKAFDSNLSGMFLSAAKLVGEGASLQNLPPIHPLMASRFTADFFRGVGIDPRAQGIDAQAFSKVALAGVVNFVSALNTYGPDAPMDVLNSPDMAQLFVEALHQSIGDTNPVTREQALAEADMLGRFIQGKYQRLMASLPQSQAAKPSRANKRESKQRWATNNDVFDQETMESFDREQAIGRRSASSDEFSPKPRAQKSRFATNTDIFSDDVLDMLNTRL